MPFKKQNNFDQELKEFGNVNLTGYIMDIKKCLPRDIRSKVEALLATGLFEIDGVSLQKIGADVPEFIPLTKEIVDKIHTGEIKVNPPLGRTAFADQLVGKNIKHQPLMLESTEPIPEDEEEEEEDDDDIPESWKVPYIDPDDYPEEPEQSIVPIEPIKEKPRFEGLDQTPEWAKQKDHKGKNMNGIDFERTDGEKFYKFIHTDGSIEFLPKDIRMMEKDKQNGKEIKIEPVEAPRLKPIKREPKETHEPDTSKYDVINPMIMVLNSFEKEQFRIRLKYTYNHNEQVIEERLSKLMLSTDQEYIMNQKLDLLEWYEEDQKKRKEIENYDFFSDDNDKNKK